MLSLKKDLAASVVEEGPKSNDLGCSALLMRELPDGRVVHLVTAPTRPHTKIGFLEVHEVVLVETTELF
jgi:hypothetical protein